MVTSTLDKADLKNDINASVIKVLVDVFDANEVTPNMPLSEVFGDNKDLIINFLYFVEKEMGFDYFQFNPMMYNISDKVDSVVGNMLAEIRGDLPVWWKDSVQEVGTN